MHLFLYQAKRHTPAQSQYAYSSNRSRYVQGTIRGDFDLELLRRGIKGRFKILPHGEHDFQKALKSMDLLEEFYGHVIQIEKASNAIWFKLNYDQVGKGITKYIGGWRDLDPAAIGPEITEYLRIKNVLNQKTSLSGAMRSYDYSLKSFIPRITQAGPEFDTLRQLNQESDSALRIASLKLVDEMESLRAESLEVQNRVREYLNERKF